jgi:hypothetical protein
LFFGASMLVIATQLSADDRTFRAGAYAIDITPENFPVESAGSMTPRIVISAHDPLYARCLVLDNGDTRIAFATCDSCMIPREIFDAAKQRASAETGIPIENILASATHTHTAVCSTSVFQSNTELEYGEFLKDRIAKGIIEAASRLEPARIGWAVGNNSRQVFNRRWYMRSSYKMEDPFERGADKVKMNPPAGASSLLKPAGPTDPELPILSVQALDGRPIALLANYSLHYVGGVPAEMLSADYFGEFAKQFSRLIGANDERSGFVAIMSNGTSGDINNINFFEPRVRKPPFEQIRLVGLDVAESAWIAYKRVEYVDWVPIKMREREIELGVRRPTKEEIARARAKLAAAGEGPYKDRVLIYALETLRMAEYPPTVKVKLQAIRIGELGIVSSPCETFVETGLAIKQASPLKPTFTIELANGYNGYLPTPEQHALGGYETWRARSSYLAVDAEPKVRRTLLELLSEVAK